VTSLALGDCDCALLGNSGSVLLGGECEMTLENDLVERSGDWYFFIGSGVTDFEAVAGSWKSLSKPTLWRRRDMLDCNLSGLTLLFVSSSSDLSIAMSLWFLKGLVLRESEICETDFLLRFEKLLLSDRLGRRSVLAAVTDRFGISIFPAVTEV
jgi:hypothetical protein